MERSKKIDIKICTRPCDKLIAKILKLKHIFIIDEYNNIYEFSTDIDKTNKLTKWYLENDPQKIKIRNLKVNRKLFYRVMRIQRRITKRKRYSVLSYNCRTYVNSILTNLTKFQ